MITIQRAFWPDKKEAIKAGIELPIACSKVALYRAIADYLNIAYDVNTDLDILWDLIDAENARLACVATMPVRKPIKRCDRTLKPKPVLKTPNRKLEIAKPIGVGDPRHSNYRRSQALARPQNR